MLAVLLLLLLLLLVLLLFRCWYHDLTPLLIGLLYDRRERRIQSSLGPDVISLPWLERGWEGDVVAGGGRLGDGRGHQWLVDGGRISDVILRDGV